MPKEYRNETIHIDGREFVGDAFIDCTLVYSGTGNVKLHGCTFTNCRWTFAGAAANTLTFLAGLYHGGFRDLVDRTIDNIRRGEPSESMPN